MATDAQLNKIASILEQLARTQILIINHLVGDEAEEESEQHEENETEPLEEASWESFLGSHSELAGFETNDGRFIYHGTAATDAQIVRALLVASVGRPDGVSAKEVSAALFGTAEEATAKPAASWRGDDLTRTTGVVAHRLFALTHPCNGPVVTRTRKRRGNLPSLWVAAVEDPDDDSVCHTVIGGRYLCGLTRVPRGSHSRASCEKLGHKRCAVCELLR